MRRLRDSQTTRRCCWSNSKPLAPPADSRKTVTRPAESRRVMRFAPVKYRLPVPECQAGPSGTGSLNFTGANRITRRRSEEHTSELQSHSDIVCRLLLEKKK